MKSLKISLKQTDEGSYTGYHAEKKIFFTEGDIDYLLGMPTSLKQGVER